MASSELIFRQFALYLEGCSPLILPLVPLFLQLLLHQFLDLAPVENDIMGELSLIVMDCRSGVCSIGVSNHAKLFELGNNRALWGCITDVGSHLEEREGTD